MALVILVLAVGVGWLSLGTNNRQSQIDTQNKTIGNLKGQVKELSRQDGVLSQQLKDNGIKPSTAASSPGTANITVHVQPAPVVLPITTTTTRPASTTTTTRPSPTTTTTTRPAPCPTVPVLGRCVP